MLKYVDRLNTNSYKWDALEREFGSSDLIAMWVADMDFECADCIREALHKYSDDPLGYFATPKSYYETVAKWEKERHGFDIKYRWISVTPGIVPALHWAVRAFVEPGEAVMINAPVYYPFKNAIVNGGCKCVESHLVATGTTYVIDYDKFEKDIVENDVKMYILCNPHNPVGRVWTEDELRKILEICRKYNVLVISDEIHQDIVDPNLGRKKVTTATVDGGKYQDMIITMASVSKTFNIAAVQNSFIIIPNPELKEKFDNFLGTYSLDDVNGFGHVAAQAAMQGGAPWLEEVLDVIYGNYEYMRERFNTELPDVTVYDLEGTYLPWVDFGKYVNTREELEELIQGKCKIAIDYGEWFGGPDYAAFARFNLATKREFVEIACDRIIAELKK